MKNKSSLDSFGVKSTLTVGDKSYQYFSLKTLEEKGVGDISKLPISIRVLLENLLRYEDGNAVSKADIQSVAEYSKTEDELEIAYRPARVLMQDFTGVPAVADLAAMRNAVDKAGYNPDLINPLSPVDLVIDHSVMIDYFGTKEAFEQNMQLEMERNVERYRFLRWGQEAFQQFRVVPPGTGICHQVNLEYLAKVVWSSVDEQGDTLAYPDTLVGTDSHTTMVNGLGVLGWGVGGIEAEAAMLGQPISMLLPEVIGVNLTGTLKEGITATDLVLSIVELLRKRGVVGKFVEFFGEGVSELSLADRATIANMAPEYGATCGFFPIDEETISYLRLSNRDQEVIDLVESYTKAQGMWRSDNDSIAYTDELSFDLNSVESSVSGPKRPQDRVLIKDLKKTFQDFLSLQPGVVDKDLRVSVANQSYTLGSGDVVIAAITSCTNTSNPAVMLGAGLVAQKALEKGLKVKPWVKTSLAPGSKVVGEYLKDTGLDVALEGLGFHVAGIGCTMCIGNSGGLAEDISAAIAEGQLNVCSVLSGNRNFEGRIHQEVKANWLASPLLVVVYALTGTVNIDLLSEPVGYNDSGESVYLKDIWPSNDEIRVLLDRLSANMFEQQYQDVFLGTKEWQALPSGSDKVYEWDASSTYIKEPPFFEVNVDNDLVDNIAINQANILALLGDSVTTDHISPAGAIQPSSPAGQHLQQKGVQVSDFNSYGSRRGNHDIMMRGTFANIRIRNRMLSDVEGGYTKYIPTGETLSIYDAAMRYQGEERSLVIFAGKEYGTGSSRDWAAKGTKLLGVKAVIAESFERIHRSNLIGMGVLPVQWKDSASIPALTGEELVTIQLPNDAESISPRQTLELSIEHNGVKKSYEVLSRLDTDNEVLYYRSGGILQYVLNDLVKSDVS